MTFKEMVKNLKKKKISYKDCYDRIRKVWKINPATKRHKNKQKKSRQQKKINLKKKFKQGDY